MKTSLVSALSCKPTTLAWIFYDISCFHSYFDVNCISWSGRQHQAVPKNRGFSDMHWCWIIYQAILILLEICSNPIQVDALYIHPFGISPSLAYGLSCFIVLRNEGMLRSSMVVNLFLCIKNCDLLFLYCLEKIYLTALLSLVLSYLKSCELFPLFSSYQMPGTLWSTYIYHGNFTKEIHWYG